MSDQKRLPPRILIAGKEIKPHHVSDEGLTYQEFMEAIFKKDNRCSSQIVWNFEECSREDSVRIKFDKKIVYPDGRIEFVGCKVVEKSEE
jgi:hypothetical protein